MRKARRQKVALRFRRREEIKSRARKIGLRAGVLILAAGFVGGTVSSGDSFLSRFMDRHTPALDLVIPSVLTGTTPTSFLPGNPFWLWLPGIGPWVEKRLCQAHPQVQSVMLQRDFGRNRVRIQLEPRRPLVLWKGSGLDREGVLFPVAEGPWGAVPQAELQPHADRRLLSQWIAQLADMPEVWPTVAALKQDAFNTMHLTLKSGVTVVWGPLDAAPDPKKGQMLARVLEDAHLHLNGAASADLRFFDQGRIIVQPKTAKR